MKQKSIVLFPFFSYVATLQGALHLECSGEQGTLWTHLFPIVSSEFFGLQYDHSKIFVCFFMLNFRVSSAQTSQWEKYSRLGYVHVSK